MASVAWSDDFYVTAYVLAKEGLADKNIAESLGISTARLRLWVSQRPALSSAIEQGRQASGRTMREFIVGHIPPGVADVWDAIVGKWDAAKQAAKGSKSPNAANVRAAELSLLTDPLDEGARQQLYLTALAATAWNPAKACKMIGLPTYVLSGWKRDPKFIKLFSLIRDAQHDFVEGQLMGLVEKAHPAVTMYVAKTLLAERGYAEERKHTHKHEVSGEVKQITEHRISLEDLNLPIELMAQIMEHVDRHREAQLRISPIGDVLDGEFVKHHE